MLGAVIAGGRSSRFGSDKAVALLGGRPLIDHAIGILTPHVDRLVICGRQWSGLTSLADPAPDLGPLGGIAAALAYAEAEGFGSVLTIACDMPEVPEATLVEVLAALPSYCADAPILGHWPANMASALLVHVSIPPASLISRQAMPGSPPVAPVPPAARVDAGITKSGGKQGRLSIRRWADAIGATAVPAPNLRNINTPADLT